MLKIVCDMNKFAFALAVIVSSASYAANVHDRWQCGRDFVVGTGLYGTITRPHGEPEEIWLNNGPPLGSPDLEAFVSFKTVRCERRYRNIYQWRGWGDRVRLYYRNKPYRKG